MNTEELIAYLLTPVAQVAIIIGLAEIVKRFGLNTKYIPLVDIGLGLVSGILVYGIVLEYGIIQGLLIGLFMGLSACGLFSGVKNLTERSDENEGY